MNIVYLQRYIEFIDCTILFFRLPKDLEIINNLLQRTWEVMNTFETHSYRIPFLSSNIISILKIVRETVNYRTFRKSQSCVIFEGYSDMFTKKNITSNTEFYNLFPYQIMGFHSHICCQNSYSIYN
jgi:hypothetical protein